MAVLAVLPWAGPAVAGPGAARLAAVPVLVLLAVLAGGRGGRAGAEVRDPGAPFPPYAWASLAAWLVAAPIWIGLLLTAGPPDLGWTRFPYLDKRWLIALYWLSVGAALALPWLLRGLHRVAAVRPRTARSLIAALRGLAAGAPAAAGAEAGSRPRPGAALVRAAAGVLLATAMFGPPWHTDRVGREINLHETIHWSGLQAVANGYAPYLGPASVNYGPGLQLLAYASMSGGDRFTVPGFRATFGLGLWIAGAVVLALSFVLLRPPAALLTAALLPLVSPAALWTWGADGTLRGFWGWANPLRTVGGLVLGLAIVVAAGARPGRRADVARGLVVGLVWGVLSYAAQENMVAGGTTIAWLLGLLLATGTLGLDRLVRLGAGLGAGFAAAWAPVVAYYGRLGRLGELWYNYTAIPRRFARGYGNTPYHGTLADDPVAVAFYVTPFLAVLLALAVLVRSRPLRFAAPLDRDRLLVLAPAIAILSTYPSALLRSDATHFIGTLAGLPVLLAAGLVHLPRCFAAPAARWRARLAVLALAGVTFWPTWRQAPESLARFFVGRTLALNQAPETPWQPPDEIARRFGRALCHNPTHLPHLEIMRAIKEAVGDGRVFVQISERYHKFGDQTLFYAGGIYFLADLVPGPIWLERTDMVADAEQLRRFQRHFRRHVDEFDFVVSLVPDSGEIRAFRQANPGGTVAEITAGEVRVWIYGRGPRAGARASAPPARSRRGSPTR